MRNTAIREAGFMDEALRSVASLLPASWSLERLPEHVLDGRADTVVKLTGPGWASVRFMVEARGSGIATPLLLAGLQERAREGDLPLLFVSDYIGPSLREAFTAGGISYADATGRLWLSSQAPLVLLTGQGAQRSPRAGRSWRYVVVL